MKLFAITLTIIFACNIAHAANKWETESIIDEMTDERKCRLLAPSEGSLSLSFQMNKLFFVSSKALTFDDFHIFEIRIDKNTAFTVRLKAITPNIMEIKNSVHIQKIIDEFKTGNKFIIKALTLNSVASDKGTLVGFTKNYKIYKSCL